MRLSVGSLKRTVETGRVVKSRARRAKKTSHGCPGLRPNDCLNKGSVANPMPETLRNLQYLGDGLQ